MPKAKENILLGRLKLNDERAFQEVYHYYHPQLFGLAYRYLKCHVRAEDVVHDAFMKLWDNRGRIKSNIRGFLFTAARNRAINKIRNRKRQKLKNAEFTNLSPAYANGTVDTLIYSDYERILQEAIHELSEGKRKIFELKTQKEFSNKDIADELGVSIHTVKSQYYHALKHVKEYLSKYEGIRQPVEQNGSR